jgi:hypothetical protein
MQKRRYTNEHAAFLYAEVNKSDPFARERMFRELNKGWHDQDRPKHERGANLVGEQSRLLLAGRRAERNRQADAFMAQFNKQAA